MLNIATLPNISDDEDQQRSHHVGEHQQQPLYAAQQPPQQQPPQQQPAQQQPPQQQPFRQEQQQQNDDLDSIDLESQTSDRDVVDPKTNWFRRMFKKR